MIDPYSAELRQHARAFRHYGASPEAQECEDLADKFQELEDEVGRPGRQQPERRPRHHRTADAERLAEAGGPVPTRELAVGKISFGPPGAYEGSIIRAASVVIPESSGSTVPMRMFAE